jgi:hypothetical protein
MPEHFEKGRSHELQVVDPRPVAVAGVHVDLGGVVVGDAYGFLEK